MTIALPVMRKDGLASPLSAHFGRAPYLALVSSRTGTCRVVATEALRTEGECAPLRGLAALGVEAVLCHHLGRGALRSCFEARIRVYAARGGTVAEALLAYQREGPVELSEGALCAGHGEAGCEDHGH
jgi:predicted Fe-Mo cluster-binding NifX family protein